MLISGLGNDTGSLCTVVFTEILHLEKRKKKAAAAEQTNSLV